MANLELEVGESNLSVDFGVTKGIMYVGMISDDTFSIVAIHGSVTEEAYNLYFKKGTPEINILDRKFLVKEIDSDKIKLDKY